MASPWRTCLNINIQSNVCNINSYVILNNVCLDKVLRWHLDIKIKDLSNHHESKTETDRQIVKKNLYLVLLCKLYGCFYFRFELVWNLIYYKCMQPELISSVLSKLIWHEKSSLENFEICSFIKYLILIETLIFLLFSKAYSWNFRTLCYWNRWKAIPFREILNILSVFNCKRPLSDEYFTIYIYLSPKYHLKQ